MNSSELSIIFCVIILGEFFSEKDDAIEEIPSMPGVSRFGVNQALKHLEPLVANGLETILLFGVVESLTKVSKIV